MFANSKGFEKVNIEHQSDNTIKFNIKKHHEFLPEYSEVKESQKMTVLNAPLIVSLCTIITCIICF